MKDPTLYEKESDLHEKVDIGMYYCGKRIHTIAHEYGPEIRNYYLFVLVNEGEATYYHKSGTMKLRAHDMLVMCPAESIHYVADTPWSIQWVGLYGQTVEKYMRTLGIDGEHPIVQIENYYEMEQLLEQLYQISNHRTEQQHYRQMELIFRFFSLLWKKGQKRQEYDIAESVKKILDYNFSRDISIREVADTMHLDAAYLTRKFTEKYKVAPKEYLIDKRIALAMRLLVETDADMTEIATSVGYADPLYFSRIFKKRRGVCPCAYRTSCREQT